MTATLSDETTRQLINQVARAMAEQEPSAQSGQGTYGGSRDVGPDASGAAGGAGVPSDDDRGFFDSIVKMATQCIPVITQTALGMLQQRRRELNLPVSRDPQDVERDIASILTTLLPQVLQALPGIVTAFKSQPAPRGAEEEAQRIFPLLGALIPAIASAVPGIISLFTGRRDAEAPPANDPEVSRFLGGLLSSLVPQLIQAAPSILGSIFGGRRELSATPGW